MFKQFRAIEPGEFFAVAADLANGGKDFCAVQFLSKKRLDVPLVYHARVGGSTMTNELLPILEKIYDLTKVRPVVAYERNNGGHYEAERLETMNRLGKFSMFKMEIPGQDPNTFKLGWETNSQTRPLMLGDLRQAVNKGVVTLYHNETVEELHSFITNKNGKPEAESGAHDDLVMSLAIAYQVYLRCSPVSSENYQSLQGQLPGEKLFGDDGDY